jgi:hypothetical protein
MMLSPAVFAEKVDLVVTPLGYIVQIWKLQKVTESRLLLWMLKDGHIVRLTFKDSWWYYR